MMRKVVGDDSGDAVNAVTFSFLDEATEMTPQQHNVLTQVTAPASASLAAALTGSIADDQVDRNGMSSSSGRRKTEFRTTAGGSSTSSTTSSARNSARHSRTNGGGTVLETPPQQPALSTSSSTHSAGSSASKTAGNSGGKSSSSSSTTKRYTTLNGDPSSSSTAATTNTAATAAGGGTIENKARQMWRRITRRGSNSSNNNSNNGALRGGSFSGANVAPAPTTATTTTTGGVVGGGSGGRTTSHVLNYGRLMAFLILLGVLPASLIFVVDLSVHSLSELREEVCIARTGGGALGLATYVISGVALCLLSTLYCYLWSPEAEGSGIPQMKAVMSGFYDKLKPALSVWTLAAKCLGLLCAIGGGLPVGWEGPNVHIACIIAHHLSRLPVFRLLRRDRSLRLQIMVCACSVGLASSFGTPIGGVMYALETTGTFYLVPTYWKSYMATLTGAFLYELLYKTPLVEGFANTQFNVSSYTHPQLGAFVVLGVLAGLAGAAFVACVHSMYLLRQRYNRRFPTHTVAQRFILVALVAALAAIIQYPVHLFRLDPREAINELFSADALTVLSSRDVALLLLVRFPLVAICIGLPIPAGLFIPCFVIGSCFGRLYGELLQHVFGSTIVPGGYAVVGAAAFTAGVTRALSCAVIIFEVTGQLHHMVPTLIAVLLAVIVGNVINRPIYDTLVIMKDLPYMPHMRRDRSPAMLVSDAMLACSRKTEMTATMGTTAETQRQVRDENEMIDVEEEEEEEEGEVVVVVSERATVGEVRRVLDEHAELESVPVVADVRSMRYIGAVRASTLDSMLVAAMDADVRAAVNARVERVANSGSSSGSNSKRNNNVNAGASGGGGVSGDERDMVVEERRGVGDDVVGMGAMKRTRSMRRSAGGGVDRDGDGDGAEDDEDLLSVSEEDMDEARRLGQIQFDFESPLVDASRTSPLPISPPVVSTTTLTTPHPPAPPLRHSQLVAGATHASASLRSAEDADVVDGDAPAMGDSRVVWVTPDLVPLVVDANMPLAQAHFMFVMLMPTHFFVTRRGVLVGILRRRDVVQGCTS